MEISQQPVPLQADADGVIRVGRTRARLESVLTAFDQGASAEAIVEQFPSLALADVYAAIGYYLHHREDVEVYRLQNREESRRVRTKIENRFDPTGIRERLLARQRK